MTLEECTAILGPLAIAMRVPMDEITFRAYHRLLKDVKPGLLERALDDLSREGLRFYPAATEILAACEKTRRRLLALDPYDGCPECEDQIGFRKVLNEAGQPTVERCPCKARWQHRLAAMGALEPLAALPGETTHETEQVYPTLDQLPAPVRAQVVSIATRKALK